MEVEDGRGGDLAGMAGLMPWEGIGWWCGDSYENGVSTFVGSLFHLQRWQGFWRPIGAGVDGRSFSRLGGSHRWFLSSK